MLSMMLSILECQDQWLKSRGRSSHAFIINIATACINSVAIASNESFGGWTKTFTDPRLCAAIVDRLTFNGTIIETGTDSYRLASTRARAEEPVKAS